MRIGIDLGGTKIEGIALDDGGVQLARTRVDTPGEGYDAIVRAIVALVGELEAAHGPGTVGVGGPGAIDPETGVLKNANTTALNGRALHRDLGAALGREVRVANDADCLALSEATDGAGAGARVVFGVIAGTGVGGGIVVDGRLLAGPNGVAGEWGHTPLPWPSEDEAPGPACYCGARGCVETWLSGPGLSADHERRTGQVLDGRALSARAYGGDAEARRTLDDHADRFARAIAVVVDVLDPHVIVLGGGVSNLRGLVERIEARWGRYVFDSSRRGVVRTRLVRAQHGDSSGVRGAAWLWPR